MVASKNNRRAGESLFRTLQNTVAKILKGCFQDRSRSPGRSLTSCSYTRELSPASALNCVQSSSISIPAVSRRQPSLERHNARLVCTLSADNDSSVLVKAEPRAMRHLCNKREVTSVAYLNPALAVGFEFKQKEWAKARFR